MLYLTTPFGGKQAMFQEAAAVGASTIRLDVELSAVFPDQSGPPDWAGIDQYMLAGPPLPPAACSPTCWRRRGTWPTVPAARRSRPATCALPPTRPPGDGRPERLPPTPAASSMTSRSSMSRTGARSFLGTPQQYAHILAASYAAIHAADPAARVALGGLMDIGTAGRAWLDAVLATPGVDAARSYDIANIHVRTPAADAAPVVAGWRRYFSHRGFHGPLWVTETGYPADPAWQSDSGYHDGPASQAAWMTCVIPAMLTAGRDDRVRDRARLARRALRIRGHPAQQRPAHRRPVLRPPSLVLRGPGGSPDHWPAPAPMQRAAG